jgi:drug/metabolite transporter (DMT)-like permease
MPGSGSRVTSFPSVMGRAGPYAALGMGMLAASSAAPLIRVAQGMQVPSLIIAALRLTIASLLLAWPGTIRVRHEYGRLTRADLGLLLASGLLLGAHFASWITSLAHTSVMSSVVLVTTTPLWIALASPLVLGERNPLATWLGILTAMLGGTLIGLADSSTAEFALQGDLLALVGAVAGAGYMMIGRRVRQRLSLLAYIWPVYSTAAVVLMVWTALLGLPLIPYPLAAYGVIALLALGPQLIGHSSINYALRHLSATYVAVVMLAEPVGSTILAALFLKEHPGLPQLGGAVLVLAGIAVASHAEQLRRVPGEATS